MTRIISFAWTTDALLADRKSVTRRDWAAKTAAGFKQGDLVQAYNRSPRNGGERVGYIEIAQDPYLENLNKMTGDDFEAEGFAYLEENPGKVPHNAPWGDEGPLNYFLEWRKRDHQVWVVRFKFLQGIT